MNLLNISTILASLSTLEERKFTFLSMAGCRLQLLDTIAHIYQVAGIFFVIYTPIYIVYCSVKRFFVIGDLVLTLNEDIQLL